MDLDEQEKDISQYVWKNKTKRHGGPSFFLCFFANKNDYNHTHECKLVGGLRTPSLITLKKPPKIYAMSNLLKDKSLDKTTSY